MKTCIRKWGPALGNEDLHFEMKAYIMKWRPALGDEDLHYRNEDLHEEMKTCMRKWRPTLKMKTYIRKWKPAIGNDLKRQWCGIKLVFAKNNPAYSWIECVRLLLVGLEQWVFSRVSPHFASKRKEAQPKRKWSKPNSKKILVLLVPF